MVELRRRIASSRRFHEIWMKSSVHADTGAT